MCLVLFLGSDSPLPTTEPWNDTRPFSVIDVTADCPAEARPWLNRSFVYCLQSLAGCGCAFSVQEEAERDAMLADLPAEMVPEILASDDLDRRGIAEMRDYLIEATRLAQQSLQLLVTWAGLEGTAPKARATVTPDYFVPTQEGFGFEEFTLFEILPQK